MNLDTLLRETMRAHADDAPPDTGLGSAARQRAQRRRTHQVLAGGVTALAAVVAVAVAVPPLVQPGPDGPPPGTLAPPDFDLPEFPFTPGWVPDGVPDDPDVMLRPEATRYAMDESDYAIELVHGDVGPSGELDQVPITVAIYRTDPHERPLLDPRQMEEVTVRGVPGRFGSWEGHSDLIWADQPDRWVRVIGRPGVSRADLFRYAEELKAQPLPVTTPLTLAVAPTGAEVTRVNPSAFHLRVPGGHPRMVWLDLHDPAERFLLPGRRTATEVGGRPAELVRDGAGNLGLSIRVRSDLMLTISHWKYGEANLRAFAAGVTVTPDARP